MKLAIRIEHAVVLTLLSALLLASVPAFAEERGSKTDRADFCTGLGAAREQALSRMGERKESVRHSDDSGTKKTERLAKLDTARTDNDAKRQEHYEALDERATTDAQKEAVAEFKATVETLVDTRRAAIDAAIEDFEDGVAALLEERKAAVDEAAGDINDRLEAVFDDAEAACDDGDAAPEVRQTFMSDMQALREEQKGKRDTYNFTDELAALRADRKAAVDAAQAAFRTGLAAAKEELKAAFSS